MKSGIVVANTETGKRPSNSIRKMFLLESMAMKLLMVWLWYMALTVDVNV